MDLLSKSHFTYFPQDKIKYFGSLTLKNTGLCVGLLSQEMSKAKISRDDMEADAAYLCKSNGALASQLFVYVLSLAFVILIYHKSHANMCVTLQNRKSNGKSIRALGLKTGMSFAPLFFYETNPKISLSIDLTDFILRDDRQLSGFSSINFI